MDKEKQRARILRFLGGLKKERIDAFCIYQWIERCHFHGWWKLGIRLSSFVPPNSLNPEYQKRLNYLLMECKNKFKEQYVELKNPGGHKYFTVPKYFWNGCENLGIALGGKSDNWIRLEINNEKIILIEGIKHDCCLYKFPGLRKDDLIEWLNNHNLVHLIKNIRPIESSHRKQSWLKLSWEEAADLIPHLTEYRRELFCTSKVTITKEKKDWPKRYIERERFWKELLEKAKEQTVLHANISPGPFYWIGAGAGKWGLGFNYVLRQHETQVELYIDRGDNNENKGMFDKLLNSKDIVEEVFGEDLQWERLDNKRACRICKRLTFGGYEDKNKWPEIQYETIDAMCRLAKAIKPLVADL